MIMDVEMQWGNGVSSPQLVHRFHTIPTAIPAGFVVEIDKPILKFTWKCKRPRRAETILKELKVGGINSTWLSIEPGWYWHKNQCINQGQNRVWKQSLLE